MTNDSAITEANLARWEEFAEPIYRSTVTASQASKYEVSGLGQYVVRLIAEVRRLRAPAPTDDESPMCGVEHLFNGHVCSLREGHPAGHVCDYKYPEAVYNTAEAPTDDERDQLTLIARDVHLYDGGENAAITGPHARRIADAALADGFHRSVPPEPQGEPSDAQVKAALLGYFPEVEGDPELQDWGRSTRERMRAALRAAGEVKP